MNSAIAAITALSMLLAPLGAGVKEATNARSIQIVGDLPERAEFVLHAVKRFETAGLELPTLTIHLHEGMDECRGHRGLYGRDGDYQRVDLCSDSERVILHELAHAWQQHRIDDYRRKTLLAEWNLEYWQNDDVPHHERGSEVAANLVALGLGFEPFTENQANLRSVALDRFEALTGIRSPRLPSPSA